MNLEFWGFDCNMRVYGYLYWVKKIYVFKYGFVFFLYLMI